MFANLKLGVASEPNSATRPFHSERIIKRKNPSSESLPHRNNNTITTHTPEYITYCLELIIRIAIAVVFSLTVPETWNGQPVSSRPFATRDTRRRHLLSSSHPPIPLPLRSPLETPRSFPRPPTTPADVAPRPPTLTKRVNQSIFFHKV